MSVSDIDAKCKELTDKYAGKSIRQLSRTQFAVKEEKDLEQKGIALKNSCFNVWRKGEKIKSDCLI